jgi:hypothetical protein
LTFKARHGLSAPALGLALLVAACSQPAPPPPPPAAPPPPPPPPTMNLSSRVIEQAGAYADYMAKAAATSPAFTNAQEVQSALTLAETFEPQALRRGAIAYGAVLALQDPAFVAGVRTFAADPAQRRAVVAAIYKDPAYAVGFKGSDSAAGRIVAQIGDQGTQVYTTGKAVKQAAYDVQKSAWSKATVLDRDGRLARAKSQSQLPMTASIDRVAQLQGTITGLAAASNASPVAAPYTPAVIRSLAVAALAALGEAGDASQTNIQAMMADPSTDTCLNLSKLNLYQCLAVAGPNYEDVFCLGQHVLMDVGQCLIKTAGAAMPPEPPRPEPAAAVKTVKKPAAKKPAAKKPAPKPAAKKK